MNLITKDNINCVIRIRPIQLNESDKHTYDINAKSYNEIHSVVIRSKDEEKEYPFDWVADDKVSQSEMFVQVGEPILNALFEGYNCTLFTYGQTGAGKTYTMLGPVSSLFNQEDYDKTGLIPRILKQLFLRLEDIKRKQASVASIIKCSCFEIYQEHIIDLFNNTNENLTIHEDQRRGIFVDGLVEQEIDDEKIALELILLGLKNRHMAATKMNSESSRSHLVFTIVFNLNINCNGLISQKQSRLHLIDLAGSERVKTTGATGEKIREAGGINKSLSTLGNVINGIVEGKFVPFRDSKLTYFLKDSIGGNSKTSIIANISPSISNAQETISTLKFIQRAKFIKNKARINENITGSTKLLQEEIKRLKEEVEKKNEKQSICETCKRRLDLSSMLGSNHFLSLNNKISQRTRDNKNETLNLITKPHSEKKETDKFSEDDNNKFSEVDLKNYIKEFIEKIHFLLNYEDIIKDKLVNSSSLITCIKELADIKDKFEKENQKIIIDLRKRAEHFNTIFKLKENLLNEIKENSDNNKLIDNIENLFEVMFKFNNTIEKEIEVGKLLKENQCLKYDSEQLKNNNLDIILNKNNLEILISIINDFVESNRDLQIYMKNNIEHHIKESKVDEILLELNELKLNQKILENTINQLKNENYLLNFDNNNLKGVSSSDNSIGIKNNSTSSEKQNQNFNELEDKLLLIDDQYKEIERLRTSIEGLEESNDRNENLISQFKEEIETILEGNKIYENDIIYKNNEILKHRRNLLFSNNLIEKFSKILELKNTILQKLSKTNIHMEKVKAPLVRKSIIGDIYSKNTEKILTKEKDLKLETKTDMNEEIKDVIKESINELETLIRKLTEEFNNQTDISQFSSFIEKTKNDILSTLSYVKDINEKIERLESELIEKNKILKNQKEQLKLQKDDLKKKKIIEDGSQSKFNFNNNGKQSELKVNKEESSDNNLLLKQLLEQVNELNKMTKQNGRVDNNSDLISLNKEILTYIKDIKKKSEGGNEKAEYTSTNIEVYTSNEVTKLKNDLRNAENEILKLRQENHPEVNFTQQLESFNDSKTMMLDMLKSILLNSNTMVKSSIYIDDNLKKNNEIIKRIIKGDSQQNFEIANNEIEQIEKSNIQTLENKVKEYENEVIELNKTIISGESELKHLNTKYNELLSKHSILPEKEKYEISFLQSTIKVLQEEKTRIESEILLLNSDFYKNLSESSINQKIRVLMQFKEENYRLKLELNELKKKNEILESAFQQIQLNNSLSIKKSASSMPITPIETEIEENFGIKKNGDDIIQLKKEHSDLIERILCLNIEVKSKAKTRYLRAVDYINSIVQIVDIKKFYKDLKPQPNTFRELNASVKSAINDSNGKEKRSFHNKSVEPEICEPGNNKNYQQNLIEKKRIIKKKLDNLSPQKDLKIGSGTTRGTLKK